MKLYEAIIEIEKGAKVRCDTWSYADTAYLAADEDGWINGYYEDADGVQKIGLGMAHICLRAEYVHYDPKDNDMLTGTSLIRRPGHASKIKF